VSLYNVMNPQMTCPRCHADAQMEIHLYFGLRNFISYEIGDNVRWVERRMPRNGGRPPDGTCIGKGYTECLYDVSSFSLSK
jgi:hypothetical protein